MCVGAVARTAWSVSTALGKLTGLLMPKLSCRDRLDMQHQIYRVALEGKLFLAPIAKERIGRVLDVGCGTGEYSLGYGGMGGRQEKRLSI